MNTQVNTLLREAAHLDNRTLDTFIADVISLRTRRDYAQQEEAALLQKINRGLPAKQLVRLRSLNEQRQQTGLSEAEQAELTALVEKLERLNVRRLQHLTALSRLRNVPVRELMKQLGLGSTHG